MLFPFSLTIDHGLSDMSNPEFLTIRAKTEATLLDPAQTWIREHDADSETRELACLDGELWLVGDGFSSPKWLRELCKWYKDSWGVLLSAKCAR